VSRAAVPLPAAASGACLLDARRMQYVACKACGRGNFPRHCFCTAARQARFATFPSERRAWEAARRLDEDGLAWAAEIEADVLTPPTLPRPRRPRSPPTPAQTTASDAGPTARPNAAAATDPAWDAALERLRQQCPSRPPGTCPSEAVYGCDYCLDMYILSMAPTTENTWEHPDSYPWRIQGAEPRTPARDDDQERAAGMAPAGRR